MITSELTVNQLLVCHSEIIDELTRRGVTGATTNPYRSFAFWLATKRLGLQLELPEIRGREGFDAYEHGSPIKYRILGGQLKGSMTSVKLGLYRQSSSNPKPFDFLLALVFDEGWNVRYAAKIPFGSLLRLSIFRTWVNGHVFIFKPAMLDDPEVLDITDRFMD